MSRYNFSKNVCIGWMLAAITALGLGQTLGLFLTPRPESAAVTVAAVEDVVVTGTVIRQEQPILVPFHGFWETEPSARRVSAGQTLLYLSGYGKTEKQAQLVLESDAASRMVLPDRRQSIHEAIAELQQGGDGQGLMALVMGEQSPAEEAVLSAREILESGAVTMQTVSSPAGGIFVPVTDGLEGVLTPETPEVARTEDVPVDELAAGRLITSDRWYFYGDFPQTLSQGETVPVLLLSGIFLETELTVIKAEELENGGCRALCCCDEYIEAVAKLRNLTVKILYESQIRGGNFLENAV